MTRRQLHPDITKKNRLLINLSLVLLVLITAYLLFSENGVLRYYRLQQSLETVRLANEELRKQNEALQVEIEKLKNDPEYLEEIARKRFGLIQKNEMVFNFKKNKQ